MPPPNPCKGCRFEGDCCAAGLVNRLAVVEWLQDNSFTCADYDRELFQGLEGCYP